MNPNPLIESSPLLRQLFSRMPSDAASRFTAEQLTLLHDAMLANRPRKHAVDIRLSIPIIRMYFVVLGGKERRSKSRLRQDRRMHLLWSLGNLVFIASILFGLGSAAFGLYMLLTSD